MFGFAIPKLTDSNCFKEGGQGSSGELFRKRNLTDIKSAQFDVMVRLLTTRSS
jgi:hypothetical protein